MTIDKKFVDDHMQDKNILYIPIISSINRETNKYNLDSDGNVVRFITFFEHHKNFNTLTILLPKNNESHDIIDRWVKDNDNIEIIWSDNFGKHAGEQRSDSDVVSKMEMELFELINNPDNDNDFNIVMFESQFLGNLLVDPYWFKGFEKVFWCPVCKIDNEHTRNFLEGYDNLNKKLFQLSDWSIVESPTQLKKFSLPECSIYPYYMMMDRNLKYFDYMTDFGLKDTIKTVKNLDTGTYSIYYIPYRLTDEGYKVDDVISYINYDYADVVVVYYTDPNNSRAMEDLKKKFNSNVVFIKLSTDRNTHFTMLSSEDVVVPYFEDLDFINHATLWEMMSPKSRCQFGITKEQYDMNSYNMKSCDRCFYINTNNL